MKKYILSAFAIAMAFSMSAQTSAPVFLLKSSKVVESFAAGTVDCIVFDEGEIPPVDMPFDVKVTPTVMSATFDVTPKDETMTYMVSYMAYEKYLNTTTPEEGGIMGLYEFEKSWYQWIADMYGMEWQYFMKQDLSVGASVSETTSACGWNTDYVCYVFGVDENCELVTDICVYPFRTLDSVKDPNAYIDMEVTNLEVTGRWAATASFTFTPSSDDFTYCTALYKAAGLIEVLQTSSLEDYVKSNISSFADYPSIGEDTYTSNNLLPGTDYAVIYFGFDGENGLTTDIYLKFISVPAYVAPTE